MKIVYIAHPISGNVKENLKLIVKIGREINLTEENTIPFAPYFFDCYCLNDDIASERLRGIKNDITFMRKGFIDEVRLYGNRISKGMKEEIKLANVLNIPVIPMTNETKAQLKGM